MLLSFSEQRYLINNVWPEFLGVRLVFVNKQAFMYEKVLPLVLIAHLPHRTRASRRTAF